MSVVAATLHHMGQSSQAYQMQLRHLAAHYQHQTAQGGPVDPQLLQQIYSTKMGLQNLSAHYVHFMSLVNSGAPLPFSPMRQTATEDLPPPKPEAAIPFTASEMQAMGPDGARMPPRTDKSTEQPAAETSRPAGKSVDVNALFAAKKAMTGSDEADIDIKEEKTKSALPAKPNGRSVSVLSLFAAAAAADKARSEAEEPKSTSSDTSSSNTITNSDETVMENKFAFHNAETKKKKKVGAMSAASKMKLLQMQKKKADSTVK